MQVKDEYCDREKCSVPEDKQADMVVTVTNQRKFDPVQYDTNSMIEESIVSWTSFDDTRYKTLVNRVNLQVIEDDTNQIIALPGITEEEVTAFSL